MQSARGHTRTRHCGIIRTITQQPRTREYATVSTQPSAHDTSCREPITQLLPVSRKVRQRSNTAPAPQDICVKHGRSSRGVALSTKVADTRLGCDFGFGTSRAGDAGTVVTATSAIASLGGAGVDLAVSRHTTLHKCREKLYSRGIGGETKI